MAGFFPQTALYVYLNLFIHSGGHEDLFAVFDIMNKVAMNILVQVFFF